MNKMTFYIDDNDSIILVRYEEKDGKFNNNINILLNEEISKKYFNKFIKDYPNHEEYARKDYIEFNFYDIDVDLADEMVSESNKYKKMMKETSTTHYRPLEIIDIPSYEEVYSKEEIYNKDEEVKTNKINRKKRGKRIFVSSTATLLAALTLFAVSKEKAEAKNDTQIESKSAIEEVVEYNKNDNDIIVIKDNPIIEKVTDAVDKVNDTVDKVNDTIEEVKSIKEDISNKFETILPEEKTTSEKDELISQIDTKEVTPEYDVFKLDASDMTNNSKYTTAKAYYYEAITKYANTYGIDPQLALAIATHERGLHNNYVDSGGGIGLFQIQVRGGFSWNEVTAFNFDTNEYETVKVTEESVSDVFENIKIGCMIIQNSLKLQNYDIPKAIQGYNYGSGNMEIVLNACMSGENLTKEDLSDPYNLSWLKYRNVISGGDPEYLENVFKYIEDESLLTFKKTNGEIIQFIYDNTNINNKTI